MLWARQMMGALCLPGYTGKGYVPQYRLLNPDVRRFYFSADFDLAGIDLHGATVMDVGCAGGLYSLYFSLVKGARLVVAVDSYEGKGNPAANKAFFSAILAEYGLEEKVQLVHANVIRALPIPPDSIDVIYMSNVLHHVYETVEDIRRVPEKPPEVVSLLENIRSVCAPGGACVINEVRRHNVSEVVPALRPVRMDWKRKHDPDEWASLFRPYGFQVVANDCYVPYPLKRLKRILANRYSSYLLNSRYRLIMRNGNADAGS